MRRAYRERDGFRHVGRIDDGRAARHSMRPSSGVGSSASTFAKSRFAPPVGVCPRPDAEQPTVAGYPGSRSRPGAVALTRENTFCAALTATLPSVYPKPNTTQCWQWPQCAPGDRAGLLLALASPAHDLASWQCSHDPLRTPGSPSPRPREPGRATPGGPGGGPDGSPQIPPGHPVPRRRLVAERPVAVT